MQMECLFSMPDSIDIRGRVVAFKSHPDGTKNPVDVSRVTPGYYLLHEVSAGRRKVFGVVIP